MSYAKFHSDRNLDESRMKFVSNWNYYEIIIHEMGPCTNHIKGNRARTVFILSILQNSLYRSKKKTLPKSTCPTGSFTCWAMGYTKPCHSMWKVVLQYMMYSCHVCGSYWNRADYIGLDVLSQVMTPSLHHSITQIMLSQSQARLLK